MRFVTLVVVVGMAGAAHAGRHVMSRGETIGRVAKLYGCSTEAVLRANRLSHTLVPAGTEIRIPDCAPRPRPPARTRASGGDAGGDAGRDAGGDAGDRARRALAVIDGAELVAESAPLPSRAAGATSATRATSATSATSVAHAGESRSLGEPWQGQLRGAAALPAGEGYQIRRPQRAFGRGHVVEHLRRAIAGVRALYPEVHTLAIGDLSAREGGRIGGHRSHQSGLDVDVGFYFHRVPEGYPASFAAADANLDLAATWALIHAFARTTHLDDGVERIFLDRDVQARLYRWARQRGTPGDQLAELLQYPRDPDAPAGLVRHWPNHADHLHVRFKPDGR